jgi:hypothetical protein
LDETVEVGLDADYGDFERVVQVADVLEVLAHVEEVDEWMGEEFPSLGQDSVDVE